MANPSTPVVHSLPGSGTLSLQISRAALAKVAVSGTDLVLVLQDGTQHVLRDFAMQSMLRPGLKVAFTDAPMSAAELMGSVGKVAFSEMAGLVATSAAAEAAANAPAPTRAPPPTDSEIPPKAAAAEAAADAPPPTTPAPPPDSQGLATPATDALTGGRCCSARRAGRGRAHARAKKARTQLLRWRQSPRRSRAQTAALQP